MDGAPQQPFTLTQTGKALSVYNDITKTIAMVFPSGLSRREAENVVNILNCVHIAAYELGQSNLTQGGKPNGTATGCIA